MSLQPATAIGLNLANSSCYVLSLYLFKATRVGKALDAQGRPLTRDHPQVIKARLTAASSATALAVLSTSWTLYSAAARATGKDADFAGYARAVLTYIQRAMDVSPKQWTRSLLSPLLLTATLFAGPLFTCWLDGSLPFQRHYSWRASKEYYVTSLQGLRNFIIAPITEEVVFRACIAHTSVAAGQSMLKVIFLSPLYFSTAHAHHAYEHFVGNDRTKQAALVGCLTALVQLTYTSLFGWYATFVYLRTGSLFGVIVSHTFCNIMGLPMPHQALQRHRNRKARLLLLPVYALGIGAFCKLLYPLTASRLYASQDALWRG
ncbi:uncharacterized protein L969DRAFT_93658 [Mixia osmundae IAM 14324]|uniref:intramembrane prenyl-peptidase Rce1 n=1 Tax=Mixia osmundae (strain CBS 9802 / IAM 14324 / JCM 22182 / KY 12970) TaxID=764103 RepID=G7E977_MIXOS|nr:uncharacterized protein L969DRAFT_93658 [Mixia osmundae IAM 14324]KEI39818.1 hypothetical protein L969DRAFT_93658 [Mixia osmundae IAM 14324]GAA99196.1 hypothetical protein E5Q_05888 [Mixia osmundae IAM 14324]